MRRPGGSEYAIMVNFNISLQPYLPLGTEEKFCNPDFPIPISFIYGENDWTRITDSDFGKKCVEVNCIKHPGESKFHLVPNSGHNMHMDNPQALTNLILNDILGLELPVRTLDE